MSGRELRAAERVLATMERRLIASRKILEQAPDAQNTHEYIAALEAEADAREELLGSQRSPLPTTSGSSHGSEA